MPGSSSALVPRRGASCRRRRSAHASGRVPNPLEELGVLLVRQRIAPFDEIEAEAVQPLGDQQLVLQRKADPFALAAVAERGVVDLDPPHGRLGNFHNGGELRNENSPKTTGLRAGNCPLSDGARALTAAPPRPIIATSPTGTEQVPQGTHGGDGLLIVTSSLDTLTVFASRELFEMLTFRGIAHSRSVNCPRHADRIASRKSILLNGLQPYFDHSK